MVAVPKDKADADVVEPVDDEKPDDAVVVDEAEDEGLIRRDVEPTDEADTDAGDVIELVRTGVVRMRLAGDRYRLRRPFFGEFKRLRLAVEDMNDEISQAVDEQVRVARQAAAEAEEHKDDDADAFVDWRTEVRKRTTAASRTLTEVAEDRRYEWWILMWDLLTLDGRPDDFPSWITDPNVSTALLGHWRAAPLGRG